MSPTSGGKKRPPHHAPQQRTINEHISQQLRFWRTKEHHEVRTKIHKNTITQYISIGYGNGTAIAEHPAS